MLYYRKRCTHEDFTYFNYGQCSHHANYIFYGTVKKQYQASFIISLHYADFDSFTLQHMGYKSCPWTAISYAAGFNCYIYHIVCFFLIYFWESSKIRFQNNFCYLHRPVHNPFCPLLPQEGSLPKSPAYYDTIHLGITGSCNIHFGISHVHCFFPCNL